MNPHLILRFSGLQLLENENPHQAIHQLLLVIDALNLYCTTVEVFGILTQGNSSFVRFRTDCPLKEVLFDTLIDSGRGVIIPDAVRGYRVKFPSGREGALNCSQMLAPRVPGQNRIYRGPKVKNWDRQFLGTAAPIPERVLLMGSSS
jgi:hypothetical protein